jgi:polyferredoxin
MRQPLFVRLSDGRIQNSYELHLENKTDKPVQLAIMMRGLAGADLDVGKLASLELPPQRSLRVLARVRWGSSHDVKGSRSFAFNIIPQDRRDMGMISAPAIFYLPGKES